MGTADQMKNYFYDFIKYDGEREIACGDFSGAESALSDNDRWEFLERYAAFLDKKNGTQNGSETVTTAAEAKDVLKKICYGVNCKRRKRFRFNSAQAYLCERRDEYAGWKFYGNAKREENAVVFTDGTLPPVPAAQYYFPPEDKAEKFSFSVYIPHDYLDAATRRGEGKKPLTTTCGRYVELRRGIKEVLKLQFYRNGELYARVGVPDIYHPKNVKIGDYVTDANNEILIELYENCFKIMLNGKAYGEELPLTNAVSPDSLFICGGFRPEGMWKFSLKEIGFAGGAKRDFFVEETAGVTPGNAEMSEFAKPPEYIGMVSLPYAVGTEKNKDKCLILQSSFVYEGGRAVLHAGSLDPSGVVKINGKIAAVAENFTKIETDVTPFLQHGQNEIQFIVNPRAPEVNYGWHRSADPYIGWFCREAYVDFLPESYIDAFTVKTLNAREDGVTVSVKLSAVNAAGKKWALYLAKAPYGREEKIYDGAAENETEATLSFQAESWSPENPALYILRAELYDENGIYDDYALETGFRTIEQKNGDILLNGKKILLTGALLMQFLPPYEEIGVNHVCPTDEEIVRQALCIKKMNGNTARLHFLGYGSNDPRYGEIFDRLGLMTIWTTRLIDSIEGVEDGRGWRQKEAYCLQIKEMLSHPSVIMWEGSNEFHADKYTFDVLFDEFVSAVKRVDDTRLLCPSSHIYYGGGLYGNSGFYYQDDGTADQDFNAAQSSFGWTDPLVVRSSHNYDLLLGYGNKWDMFRKQAWKSQPALFASKEHAYIISEFAVAGRQDHTVLESKAFFNAHSYELSDEKNALGRSTAQSEWKLSQAYQALCAYNTVKYMRYLGADGLLWCCLTGGANDAGYLKPVIDFYGYAKQAFYALKEGYAKTVCFSKSTDVLAGRGFTVVPVITGCEKGGLYNVTVSVKDADGNIAYTASYKNVQADFQTELPPFTPELKSGYYAIEYVTEEISCGGK